MPRNRVLLLPVVGVLLGVLLLAGCCRSPCPRSPCPRRCPPPRVAPGAPWVSIFDGRSLAGWITTGGRHDGDAVWTVEDGVLVGREGEGHAGGLLYTETIYRDVEIELHVRMTYPFDSGIFLRMRHDEKGPQVTLDHRPDGEIAGIYAEGWWHHNEAGKDAYVRDAWNRVRVRCTGDPLHIRVWLNGELVTDYRFPEDAEGFARSGLIGLQVHGARDDGQDAHVAFRNIVVREIPEAD